MISRRRFLLTLPALAALPRAAASQAFSNPLKKKPPAPPLPDEVAGKTSEKYRQAYRVLTGKEL